MEYFAIFASSADNPDADSRVFENQALMLKSLKNFKDARFKSFKSRSEALKFAKNGPEVQTTSILDSILKSPTPNQVQPTRNLEKSNFPAPKSQDLVKFRKEIEQNNLPKVYEMINMNPRYLVSSGDTPSILKVGPWYNALHVAAMNKNDKMAKLILQTVEQTEFIELLHGVKDHPNAKEMSQFLLESYLNTPDKARNETPLHFASKLGAVDVIKVLISYPMCRKTQNSEGLYPDQIICTRAPDGPGKEKAKKEIEELLKENYFVPVLRSTDSSVQPSIGDPFTPANMPKLKNDPMSPSMEIKAYAGPMTADQAQSFRKRWKTPPRLAPAMNLSFSPKSSPASSPFKSPRASKSLTEVVSSTPKHKKKLFAGAGDEEEDSFLDNINGNHCNGALDELDEEDLKREIFDDLMETKLQMTKETYFHRYRNPEPILETPIRAAKNDNNSNHLNQNFNTSHQLSFLDESGSIFNSENVCESASFQEKHIRLTDLEKGLEKIGRDLAVEHNVGWKEHWDFLGRFLDIRSEEGLTAFENFLKQKQQKTLSPLKSPTSLNDSFGLGSICAGFSNIDLNGVSKHRNGLTSPTTNKPPTSFQFPLANPYMCIEQSCRTFSKRLANQLESESVQDQYSYEKTLMQEINKLNVSIDSYQRDPRFSVVNFRKVHSRYSFLLVSCLKRSQAEVKYLRAFTPLISKVYSLASRYMTLDPGKNHVACLSKFISGFIEKQEKISSAESFDTEIACVDAWNGSDIVECSCCFEVNLTSSKHRREIRKKLYSEKTTRPIDLWAARIPESYDDEDLFHSCSDDDSDDEKFFTPPQSPANSDDEDESNIFEESLENFEDEKTYDCFINGDKPSKTDSDVFNALSDRFTVEEAKFPLVAEWYNAMKQNNNFKSLAFNPILNNFRICTPKLKLKSSLYS